ncbi:MAG: hypothetical protein JO156_11645, partial [Solirubrobacterales bacterium]|nr:hypothetical protein [Solirubrobacterales bacterium]
MGTTSEPIDSAPAAGGVAGGAGGDHAPLVGDAARLAAPSRLTRWAISLSAVRSTILIYLGTRALLLLVASLDDVLRHHAF